MTPYKFISSFHELICLCPNPSKYWIWFDTILSSKIVFSVFLDMFGSTLITGCILFIIQVELIAFIMKGLIQVYLSLRVLTMKVLLSWTNEA